VCVQLRSQVRRLVVAQDGGSDDVDDDQSVSSTDSRRFSSRKWLSGRVREMRRNITPLSLGTHKVVPYDDRDRGADTQSEPQTSSRESLSSWGNPS
jgi:hypothetical protein